jgi:hypothetical protein
MWIALVTNQTNMAMYDFKSARFPRPRDPRINTGPA